MRRGPLDGLLVVDLTRFVSGPYCTMLLADAGATVVKVEPPGGDPARKSEPLFPTGEGGVASSFLRMNRNKHSVELDLKSAEGREGLTRLVERADALVENFRAGVLARLGFDDARLAKLNPRLVYASISGFGHSDSSHRDRPAFNLIAEYEAGVYHRGGDAPSPLGPYVGDLFPGLHALSGILMALHERQCTGRGSRVDISMFDSMLSLNEAAGSNGTWMIDDDAGAPENFYCPSGVYPTRDGFVCLDVVTESQWQRLCSLMRRTDLLADARLASGVARVRNYKEALAAPLLGWLGDRSAEEVVQVLAPAGVPSAVVRRPADALLGQQSSERGMVVEVRADEGPGLKVAGNPIRVGAYPRPGSARVPRPGEDTERILGPIRPEHPSGAWCQERGSRA